MRQHLYRVDRDTRYMSFLFLLGVVKVCETAAERAKMLRLKTTGKLLTYTLLKICRFGQKQIHARVRGVPCRRRPAADRHRIRRPEWPEEARLRAKPRLGSRRHRRRLLGSAVRCAARRLGLTRPAQG